MTTPEPARILVIESDEKVGGLLGRFLGRKGFEVELTSTGVEGLESSTIQRPDVALVSAVLSDGDGADVCDDIRLLDPSITLILMGSRPVLDAATSHGAVDRADHLVYKPYSAVELLRVLRDAVDERSQRPAAVPPEPDPHPSQSFGDSFQPGDFDGEIEAALDSMEEVLSDSWSASRAPSTPPFQAQYSSGEHAALLVAQGSDDGMELIASLIEHESLEEEAPARDETDFGDLFPPEPGSTGAGLLGAPRAQPAAAPHPPSAPQLPAEPAEPAPREWAPPPSTALQTLLTPVSDQASPPAYPGHRQAPSDGLLVWGGEGGSNERMVGGYGDALRDEVIDGSVTWQPEALRAEAAEIEPAVVALDEDQFTLRPMVPVEPHDPRGIYGEITMAQLMYNCFRDLFTGQVIVRRGQATKIVFILNGRPINSESNIRAEALGSRLLADGIITEHEHRESVASVHRHGVRQGEALIALGAIDSATLNDYLRRQVSDRVISCFSWTGAEYGLTYDPALQDSTDTFDINPLVLIFDGIKNAFPVAPLVTHFDQYTRRAARSTDLLHNYRTMLREFEDSLALASLCDGRRTLGDLINASPFGLVDTLRVLRALEIIGCLHFLDTRAGGGEESRPVARAAVRRPGSAPLPSPRESERPSRRPPTTRTPEVVRGSTRRPSAGAGEPERTSVRRPSGPLGSGEHDTPTTRRPSAAPGLLAEPAASGKRTSSGSRSGEHSRPRPAAASGRPSARATPQPGTSTITPPPTGTPAGRSELDGLRKTVNELHDGLGVQSHYELFGVEPSATTDEIRSAFQRLISTVHPNRVAALSDVAMTARSNEIVEHLARAYAVLKDPRQRQAYDALRIPPPKVEGPVEPDIIKAEQSFAKGKHCLESGQAEWASTYFELACKQDTHTRLYQMYLIWTRCMHAKDRRDAGALLDDLKNLVVDDGNSDEGFALLGEAMANAGNRDQAEKHLNRALKLNRNNRRATRALQELARTRDDSKAENASSGLFGKLFTRR